MGHNYYTNDYSNANDARFHLENKDGSDYPAVSVQLTHFPQESSIRVAPRSILEVDSEGQRIGMGLVYRGKRTCRSQVHNNP